VELQLEAVFYSFHKLESGALFGLCSLVLLKSLALVGAVLAFSSLGELVACAGSETQSQ